MRCFRNPAYYMEPCFRQSSASYEFCRSCSGWPDGRDNNLRFPYQCRSVHKVNSHSWVPLTDQSQIHSYHPSLRQYCDIGCFCHAQQTSRPLRLADNGIHHSWHKYFYSLYHEYHDRTPLALPPDQTPVQ